MSSADEIAEMRTLAILLFQDCTSSKTHTILGSKHSSTFILKLCTSVVPMLIIVGYISQVTGLAIRSVLVLTVSCMFSVSLTLENHWFFVFSSLSPVPVYTLLYCTAKYINTSQLYSPTTVHTPSGIDVGGTAPELSVLICIKALGPLFLVLCLCLYQ